MPNLPSPPHLAFLRIFVFSVADFLSVRKVYIQRFWLCDWVGKRGRPLQKGREHRVHQISTQCCYQGDQGRSLKLFPRARQNLHKNLFPQYFAPLSLQTKGSRKKSFFLVVRPLRPLVVPPLRLSGRTTKKRTFFAASLIKYKIYQLISTFAIHELTSTLRFLK